MSTKDSDRTFRVWGLPAGVSADESEDILKYFFDLDGFSTEPTVHSLGLDPYKFGREVDFVGTATFSRIPPALLSGNHWRITKTTVYRNNSMRISLTIDTTFDAFTPLNAIKDNEDHQIE
jgi:hypothetical protein